MMRQSLGRKKFWEDFNARCEALQADPKAWSDLQTEDMAWEQALADGLDEGPGPDEQPERRGKSGPRRGVGG